MEPNVPQWPFKKMLTWTSNLLLQVLVRNAPSVASASKMLGCCCCCCCGDVSAHLLLGSELQPPYCLTFSSSVTRLSSSFQVCSTTSSSQTLRLTRFHIDLLHWLTLGPLHLHLKLAVNGTKSTPPHPVKTLTLCTEPACPSLVHLSVSAIHHCQVQQQQLVATLTAAGIN